MRPVLSLVVHEFRTRRLGWAVLVLLVAVAGGAVLAAAAGARRTSSAYPRYLRASHASDLLVSVAGTGLPGYYAALARQPGIALVAPAVGLNVQPVTHAGRLDLATATATPADGRLGRTLDVPKVLAGRLPQAGRPGEIAVDQIGAARLHLHVGSTLPMVALPNGGLPGSGDSGGKPAALRRLTERVVGIVVTRASVDRSPTSTRSRSSWPAPRYGTGSAQATWPLTGHT